MTNKNTVWVIQDKDSKKFRGGTLWTKELNRAVFYRTKKLAKIWKGRKPKGIQLRRVKLSMMLAVYYQ